MGKAEKIAKLEEQAAQLKAKAARLKQQERKAAQNQEDSRAFMIGRFVLHQLKGGYPVPELRTMDDLLRAMDPYLVRDYDRKKFGFPPKV